MRKKNLKRAIATALAGVMLITSLPAQANANEGSSGVAEGPAKLAELTFDDAENPLAAGNAVATAPSGYSTVDRDGGKALSLTYNNKEYLELKDSQGNPLLKGKDEIVISYDIKNNRTGTNWAFFATPVTSSPGNNNEYYLGTLYGGTNMTVERYYYARGNSTSSTVSASYDSGSWVHYDVVVNKNATHIFKNGTYVASKASTTTLTDILGESGGYFYIGKATWGGGEYSEFYMDNFVIYDGITADLGDKLVDVAKGKLALTTEPVKDDMSLPSNLDGVDITWTSANPDVIANDGTVTRPDEDTEVTLTATLSCGEYSKTETKEITVTVAKNDGLTLNDYLIGEYSFEDNAKNSADETGEDEAKIFGKAFAAYNGTAQYAEGVKGKAVSFDGNYGFELNKTNIGTDFTISAWVKPAGTLPENMVMLFMGNGNPERWIGVSGNNGSSQVKVWGKGGNLSTWTTLFSPSIPANKWQHFVLTGTDGVLNAYLDGKKIGTDNRSNNPLVGEEMDVYLSLNFWDAQFKGLMDEVKIYNTCLTDKQVAKEYNKIYVEQIADGLKLGDLSAVVEDIELPETAEGGATISWSSSNPEVISADGVVTRGVNNTEVELTATVKIGGVTTQRTYTATVIAANDAADVALAKEKLSITSFISEDIVLPETGVCKTTITWVSSDEDVIDNTGKLGSKRPASGEGNADVTLTATITKGSESDTKEFEVEVMETPFGYIMGYVRGNNDRTGSLHLAYSKDGVTYTALNGNSGVLFAQIDTNDGTKNLSTGIRFAGTSIVRAADGSFELVAKQGKDNTVKYVYSSKNLLEYKLEDTVFSTDADSALYDDIYAAAQVNTNGLTIPADAKNASIIAVTKAEYENVLKRFDVVTNTGIKPIEEEITVEDASYLDEELPKTVTATYSDGSESVLNINWDTDSIDMSEAGEYTLNGTVEGYDNPLIEQRADPHIKYDETDDAYYFTASYPAFNNVNNGYDKIILRKADTITELSDANEITIWQAPSSGKMAKHVWAPEIHRIDGKWYVFFAAGNSDSIWAIRPYVLVCQNNDDPYNEASWKKADGSYEVYAATSKDSRYFKNMSLDMTYFEHNGKHYVIWADIIGQSALYMQEIDPSAPWAGTSDKVILLTTPEFGWERDSERVNEGPTIIKHDGKIFCAFSASGTGPEYCIGMLYADEDADLMDEASWTKMGYPLLTSADVPGEYGPGHNSFTVDSEGNPVFVYHARSEECYNNQCEWASSDSLYDPCRHARVKNVHWNEEGLPILKMSKEEEIPEAIKNVSIKVIVENSSYKYLNDAVIEIAEDKEYEYSGTPICPEVTVTYKGTLLVEGTDYYVEYYSNNEPGQGEIRVIAENGGNYTGSNSITFKIVAAPNMIADYDMVSTDGATVANKVGNTLNLGTQGLLDKNFVSYDGVNLLKLSEDGYLTLPKELIDDSMFTYSIVASTTKANNQWLVSIGRDSWNYCFFTPTNSGGDTKLSVAQSEVVSGRTGAWGAEYNIQSASKGKDGSFHVYTIVVDGGITALYVDGVKVGTGVNPYEIEKFADGANVLGYIGKSLYSGDPLFDGMVGEFTVYDGALTDAQVAREVADIDLGAYVKASVAGAMLDDNSDVDNIKSNLSFPAKVGAVNVNWSVLEGGEYVTADGKVIRPATADAKASVKATWSYGGQNVEEIFELTVKTVTVEELFEEITFPYGTAAGKEIYGNITLPDALSNGTAITWTCDKPEIVDVNAHENENYDATPAGTVTRPAADTTVKLTATINFNSKDESKEYTATVKAAPAAIAESDLTDYFFPYFIGEGKEQGEQIYFASSQDGLNWKDLNDGKPALISTMGEKGLRDPYIIRSAEGDKFYIIATDLKIYGNGDWGGAQTAGSQSLMVWESTDLINWSNQRMVEISASIGAGCTWAPEAMYDAKTGEYIVFWASKTESDNFGKQRMYYAKTRDFYTFTEPEVYIDYQKSCIDTTMIEHNGNIYRYTKNEDGGTNEFGAPSKTIFIEKSSTGILGEFTHIESPSLNSNGGVEGPAIFKLNSDDAETDTWCLLVDNYGAGGYYPLLTTDLDGGVFARPTDSYKMPNGARHGTPIRITKAEYDAVMAAMGEVEPTPTPEPTTKPTEKPTPTPEPTTEPTPTPEATTEPTQAPEPTATPGAQPTATPGSQPTATPTPEQPTTAPIDYAKNYTVGKSVVKIVADGTAVYVAPSKKTAASVTIPATVTVDGKTYKVTSIEKNAFKGCKKLKKVTIGKNIKSIGAKAFYGCKALKTVNVKSSVLKKIGKNALKGTATKLTVKVSKKKLKAYKKLFKKSGMGKRARVK